MVTEQKCSLPANHVECGYISLVLVTDEGITWLKYGCSTCVYSDFLSSGGSAKLTRVAFGVVPPFTVALLQSVV